MEPNNPQQQAPSIPNPQQPPVNEQKQAFWKNKWLLIVLGIVLLIAIGGGTYFLGKSSISNNNTNQPSPTPIVTKEPTITQSPTPTSDATTSNWKTYTNNELGFSIKYPQEQFIRLACPDEGLVLQTRTASNEDNDEKPLGTCARDGRFDIEVQAYDKANPEPETSNEYSVEKESIKIGDKTAYKYIMKATPQCNGICKDFVYEIRLSANGKNYGFYIDQEKNEPTLLKMLTTFSLI